MNLQNVLNQKCERRLDQEVTKYLQVVWITFDEDVIVLGPVSTVT